MSGWNILGSDRSLSSVHARCSRGKLSCRVHRDSSDRGASGASGKGKLVASLPFLTLRHCTRRFVWYIGESHRHRRNVNDAHRVTVN